MFVSPSNSHIRPATCVVVAESSGAMEPAYVGLAFADAVALPAKRPLLQERPNGGWGDHRKNDNSRSDNHLRGLGLYPEGGGLPDSREIRLGAPSVSGEISEDGPVRISEKTIVDWPEEEAERKAREAAQPVNWTDLLPVLRRYYGRPELRDVLPGHIAIRGTVSEVEVSPGLMKTTTTSKL